MKNKPVSQPDSKERVAATKVVAKAMLLKITYPGQLLGPVSNDLSREEWISFLKKTNKDYANLTDEAIGMIVDHLGKREKKAIQIANIEKVPYHHVERGEINSYKVVSLPAETVAEYIALDKVPGRVQKNDWKHWGPKQKLEYHLNLIAEGNRFEWSYIDTKHNLER